MEKGFRLFLDSLRLGASYGYLYDIFESLFWALCHFRELFQRFSCSIARLAALERAASTIIQRRPIFHSLFFRAVGVSARTWPRC